VGRNPKSRGGKEGWPLSDKKGGGGGGRARLEKGPLADIKKTAAAGFGIQDVREKRMFKDSSVQKNDGVRKFVEIGKKDFGP